LGKQTESSPLFPGKIRIQVGFSRTSDILLANHLAKGTNNSNKLLDIVKQHCWREDVLQIGKFEEAWLLQ
jgi:hypothetical protein